MVLEYEREAVKVYRKILFVGENKLIFIKFFISLGITIDNVQKDIFKVKLFFKLLKFLVLFLQAEKIVL